MLHHDIRNLAVVQHPLLSIVNLYDIRMRYPSGGTPFSTETLADFGIFESRPQDLYGYGTVQDFVTAKIDDGHAARTYLLRQSESAAQTCHERTFMLLARTK